MRHYQHSSISAMQLSILHCLTLSLCARFIHRNSPSIDNSPAEDVSMQVVREDSGDRYIVPHHKLFVSRSMSHSAEARSHFSHCGVLCQRHDCVVAGLFAEGQDTSTWQQRSGTELVACCSDRFRTPEQPVRRGRVCGFPIWRRLQRHIAPVRASQPSQHQSFLYRQQQAVAAHFDCCEP